MESDQSKDQGPKIMNESAMEKKNHDSPSCLDM